MVYLPNSRLARAQNNIFVKLHHVSLVEVHPYITESLRTMLENHETDFMFMSDGVTTHTAFAEGASS
jgi:hypothetical protein